MLIPSLMFALSTFAINPNTDSTRFVEVECLAQNILHEAPDESYEGKLAVATVTMNRVKNRNFPKTVCGVVYQPWQFSWTMIKHQSKFPLVLYKTARRIAEDVLYRQKRLESIGNALFYHNTTVSPSWASSMTMIRKIGEHLFYVRTPA